MYITLLLEWLDHNKMNYHVEYLYTEIPTFAEYEKPLLLFVREYYEQNSVT